MADRRIHGSPVLSTTPLKGEDGRTIAGVQIQCEECPNTLTLPYKTATPLEVTAKFFRNKGWDIDAEARYAICPACNPQAKAAEPTMTKHTEVTQPVTPSTIEDFSVEGLKRQRQMFALLDDHFNAEQGQYRQGWSDKRLAEETGLALSAVKRARDAAWGTIKPPQGLLDAQTACNRARTELAKEVSDLRGLIASLEKDFAYRLAAIEKSIRDVLEQVG